MNFVVKAKLVILGLIKLFSASLFPCPSNTVQTSLSLDILE